jgi:alkylation response protein AidB-like acyl-CoA dehydrogenase
VAPSGIIKRVLGRIKGLAEDRFADDPLLRARIAELENELLALELTTMRVAANSVEGKPDPASSVLKLKGSVLQQQVSELVLDLAGPAGLASGAARDGQSDSDLTEWERLAGPLFLNLRKASIYGGSNEVQRQIIARNILGL